MASIGSLDRDPSNWVSKLFYLCEWEVIFFTLFLRVSPQPYSTVSWAAWAAHHKCRLVLIVTPTVALRDACLNCREMQLTWSSGTLKAIFVTVGIWAGVWLHSWLEKMAVPPLPSFPISQCSAHATSTGRKESKREEWEGVWSENSWVLCLNGRKEILSLELQLWVLWQLVCQLHWREFFIFRIQSSRPTVMFDIYSRGVLTGCIMERMSQKSFARISR